MEIDGVRYSHIVNPHTGLGLTDHSLVTILAPDCATANSLSTTVSVLGPERGMRLIEDTPGAAGRILRKPADRVEVLSGETEGYPQPTSSGKPHIIHRCSQCGTALWSTGLWPFLIGIPAIAGIAIVVRGTRHIFLARAPRALVLLIIGFIVMFAGAVGVELIANFVSPDKHSATFLAQVVIEESMEMLGVTLIAWSAFSLLEAYGLDISVHPTAGASASMQSAGS